MNAFSRVEALIGTDQLNILKNSSVALFGVGGVGGFVAEALIRSGVHKLTVFDSDVISLSNLNRQIIATQNTVGQDKVLSIKERLLSINPDAEIITKKVFYLPENANEFDLSVFDYVIDAVDTVSAKIEIILRAKNANVPVISCMGTGGKLDITKLKVDYAENTKGCPLARVVRRELKVRGINKVKVVYSEESVKLNEHTLDAEKKQNGSVVPPSMIFVPAAAGLLIAKEVVFDLISNKTEK